MVDAHNIRNWKMDSVVVFSGIYVEKNIKTSYF